jgi:hypothetical protein
MVRNLKYIIMKKLLLSVMLVCSFAIFTFSQEKVKAEKGKDDKVAAEPFNKWEIGFTGGVSNFSGEFNTRKGYAPYNDYDSNAQFGFGGFIKKNFSHVFALEFGINHNPLNGLVYHGFDPPFSNPEYKTSTNNFDLKTITSKVCSACTIYI